MEEPFVYKIYIREQGAADNGEVTDPYLLQRSYEQEVEEQIWLGKNGLAGEQQGIVNGLEKILAPKKQDSKQ